MPNRRGCRLPRFDGFGWDLNDGFPKRHPAVPHPRSGRNPCDTGIEFLKAGFIKILESEGLTYRMDGDGVAIIPGQDAAAVTRAEERGIALADEMRRVEDMYAQAWAKA